MPEFFTTYPVGSLETTQAQDEFQIFTARVMSVDHERITCSLKDERNGAVYQEVNIFPANSSSTTSTDVNLPEIGTKCMCANITYTKGVVRIAIIAYVVSDTLQGVNAVATRGPQEVPGYSTRTRSLYRKAYPGQKTINTSGGYTEKTDGGWDKTTADLSRDKLDPHSRTWSQSTSALVRYTDSGLHVTGPVSRPGAATVSPRILPDGSSENIVYLQPNSKLASRYTSGSQDITPLVEAREMVQEFALDYPVPIEVLNTSLMDQILGTTANLWERTKIVQKGNVSNDDQAIAINQTWDHPTDVNAKPVGPTTSDGPTPRRRGYIVEKVAGTLVGYNQFDKANYGQVLKPYLFKDRFSNDVASGYNVVAASNDHSETRLAASALAVRFPHEYNTTRWDVTKEGSMSFEIGSTIPKENILYDGGSYENPLGAGRSVEGHLVGSLKMVVGKNRDQEDSIDLTALGQTVFRFGADDTSLPNVRRTVFTQNRGQNDASLARTLQYWTHPKTGLGDAGSLTNKTAMENVSLRAAMDGGTIIRFGARNPGVLRKHLMNGYSDGPGIHEVAPGDPSRQDSKTSGRPTYGSGDTKYSFHDLTQAGAPIVKMLPYNWSGSPISTSMDRHGLSIDFHTVRDVLLRIGANPDTNQSLLMDLAGGLAGWFGKDNQGRSVTATLDGGAELVIGPNNQQKGLRMEITGDVDWTIKGNFHMLVTGDTVWESTTHRHNVKTDYIIAAQNITEKAMVRHTTESVDVIHNQGLYQSDENSLNQIP
jgi:hypothetical protein